MTGAIGAFFGTMIFWLFMNSQGYQLVHESKVCSDVEKEQVE